MENNNIDTPTIWVDREYIVNLIIFPIGALIDVIFTLVLGSVPYVLYFTEKGGDGSPGKKMQILLICILLCLVGCYFLIGFSQIFFKELQEKFITWKITYQFNIFYVRGYYFKSDTFRNVDVLKVEPFHADKQWFGASMGTLLTRTTYSNLNYKLFLKDGRIFYLPSGIEHLQTLLCSLENPI